MKSIVIALTLLVTNVFALDDFDLYRYGPHDRLNIERTGFVTKIVFYKSFDDLQVAFKKTTNNEKAGEVRGFTMVSPSQDVCVIHIEKPKIWDDREAMAIMGHEIYHCTLANHNKVVVDKEHKEKEDLIDQDRKIELDNLKEECKDTKFEIAGCKELEETK